MNAAWVVSGLVMVAGGLWSLSRWLEVVSIRRQTRAAFEGMRHRARDHPKGQTPLTRFHPQYQAWLRQIGSRRTARQLELQQWGLTLLTLAMFRVLGTNVLVALLFAGMAFAFPVLQVRSGVKRVGRELSREMRKLVLLLRIYVQSGVSPLHAVKRVQPHLDGRLRQLVKDTESLMGHMTFEEAMNLLAKEAPSEDLELVAKALKQGARHGSAVSENLEQALVEMNHQDQLKLGRAREQQKRAVYMKFMLFFVTPLILDVMLYVWGMFGAVSHAL